MSSRSWLFAAAVGSFANSLLYLGVVVAGPQGYGFVGAEDYAVMAAFGSREPAAVFTMTVVFFAVCGAYALSGAGLVRRLPVLRGALLFISVLYAARGLVVPVALLVPFLGLPALSGRVVVLSMASLVIGLCYANRTFLWLAISIQSGRSSGT